MKLWTLILFVFVGSHSLAASQNITDERKIYNKALKETSDVYVFSYKLFYSLFWEDKTSCFDQATNKSELSIYDVSINFKTCNTTCYQTSQPLSSVFFVFPERNSNLDFTYYGCSLR